MEYYNCMSDDYELVLYHHGVKGMKWGVRKKPDPAKQRYTQAKDAYKQARKAYRKDVGLGIGWKAIKNSKKATERVNKAEENMVVEKARYKGTKSAKAEMKTYVKEMSKSGLAGSLADANSGGRSTRLYNRIKQEKGKAYAEAVMKKTEKKAYAEIATGIGVAIGLSVVNAMLQES